ncbi:MAG: hypothetical protein R6U92_08380 [Bacillota bacterium]
MISTRRQSPEVPENRGEGAGVSFGLSSFLRGLVFGSACAAILGFQIGHYIDRRPALIFDTGSGTVRVSREALSAILTAKAERIRGVAAARVRSRARRGQTVIHLWLHLDSECDVERAVGDVVTAFYRAVRDFTGNHPVPVELIVEEIREL